MKRVRAVGMVAALLGGALMVVSCASAAPSRAVAPSAPAAAPAAAAPAGQAAYAKQDLAVGQSNGSSTGDRMVIRSASLRMVVTDVDEVISQVTSLSREMGGYIVSTESQEQNGDRVGKVSVRVPADKLEDALKRVRGMAVRVARESSTAQDITEEYVDQDARVRALKATEQQYLELMGNARTTDDIVKIQQSLTQTRTQIEQAQGRMQYLQRNSAMGLISMDLYTVGAAKPLDGGGWNAQDVLNDALHALVAVGTAVAGLGIWVLVFAPLWVPVGLLTRWWMRRKVGKVPPPARGTVPPPAPATGV